MIIIYSNVKYNLILLFVLVSSVSLATANTDYKDGYVVLVNGDTIYGQVMDRNEGAFGGLLKKIKFKPEKGRKKRYKPEQLSSYKRGEDLFQRIWIYNQTKFFKQQYISRKGLGEQYFVKVVHRGAVDLYHWEYMDEDNSTVDYIPLLKKSDSEEMVRVTQGVFGLKRKKLAEYFAGCPELILAILDKKISSVDEIINLYERNCRL